MPGKRQAPETERLSPDDLAYHAKVVENLREAQAVFGSWAQYVAGKYGLGPADTVETDGRIERQGPPSRNGPEP